VWRAAAVCPPVTAAYHCGSGHRFNPSQDSGDQAMQLEARHVQHLCLCFVHTPGSTTPPCASLLWRCADINCIQHAHTSATRPERCRHGNAMPSLSILKLGRCSPFSHWALCRRLEGQGAPSKMRWLQSACCWLLPSCQPWPEPDLAPTITLR
jgi:hypothetical protein